MICELLYKCGHCETFFIEIINSEDLKSFYNSMYPERQFLNFDDISDDIKIDVFQRGMKLHQCPNNWQSYGKVIAIRPVEE
jgi:hypothetical protein